MTALYARRGAVLTASEYDALAEWPLRRLSLTHCDVAEQSDWYVAVYLGPKATALSPTSPPCSSSGGATSR